jgi:hypothetical protein
MPDNNERPLSESGVPAIDKIASSIDTEEKARAKSELFRAMIKQLNEGAPIAPVSASDVKQLWDATRRMNSDMPPSSDVRIGLAVYAAYGFEAASAGPEQFMPIQWRHRLMSALVERGVLDDYKHGEELDEKVFRAAATIPCNKEDIGETMMPLIFAQISAEDAQKAKQEMLAGGYDPDKPNIDRKFLDWLRRSETGPL